MPPASRLLRAAALVVILAATGARAHAQSCLGLPDPDSVRYTLGAAVDGDSRSRGASVRASRLGRANFAGLFASTVDYSDLDARTVSVGGSFGSIVPVETVQRARLCPYATVSRTFGPDYDRAGRAYRTSSFGGSGSIAVGMTLPMQPRFALLPFARLGAQMQYRTQDVNTGTRTVRQTSASFGGLVGGGIGLRFGNRFTLTPAVTAPFAMEGLSALVSLSATVGLGQR